MAMLNPDSSPIILCSLLVIILYFRKIFRKQLCSWIYKYKLYIKRDEMWKSENSPVI